MKIKFIIIIVIVFSANLMSQNKIEEQLIFELQSKHVHSSNILELTNGDLLTCWFEGSGERNANDVMIKGARLKKGESKWSKTFIMADTTGHPDCNPVLFLNKNNKLFLFWVVVQANRWETSILKYRTTSDYLEIGAPHWEWQDIILLKPGEEFAETIRKRFKESKTPELAWAEYSPKYEKMIAEAAEDPKKRETGWMTRIHPFVLDNGKILLPVYSDGFNLSMIASSEDGGDTWSNSLPIVGRGNIQPAIVQKKDGTLIAYMRDNGDEPGRVMLSHSTDSGYEWSKAVKTDIPNPGASIDVISLINGNWLMVYNDVDDGRYSLAASISDDEGETWKWKKILDESERSKGSYHYPSIIQSKDGDIHVTYTYEKDKGKKSIKHVTFSDGWIKE